MIIYYTITLYTQYIHYIRSNKVAKQYIYTIYLYNVDYCHYCIYTCQGTERDTLKSVSSIIKLLFIIIPLPVSSAEGPPACLVFVVAIIHKPRKLYYVVYPLYTII